eukprot:GHVT01060725.1.p1 GENE.GHVT01060725.1~~GHVT01060725.1.p1  ORF type:complete len:116 (+),score=11.69 GHVT01060725.1:94-441(+)
MWGPAVSPHSRIWIAPTRGLLPATCALVGDFSRLVDDGFAISVAMAFLSVADCGNRQQTRAGVGLPLALPKLLAGRDGAPIRSCGTCPGTYAFMSVSAAVAGRSCRAVPREVSRR